MIQPNPFRLFCSNRFAIHADPVGVCHIERGAVDLFAVHRNAARCNHPLRFPARGHACTGQDFGDPVALRCFI